MRRISSSSRTSSIIRSRSRVDELAGAGDDKRADRRRGSRSRSSCRSTPYWLSMPPSSSAPTRPPIAGEDADQRLRVRAHVGRDDRHQARCRAAAGSNEIDAPDSPKHAIISQKHGHHAAERDEDAPQCHEQIAGRARHSRRRRSELLLARDRRRSAGATTPTPT